MLHVTQQPLDHVPGLGRQFHLVRKLQMRPPVDNLYGNNRGCFQRPVVVFYSAVHLRHDAPNLHFLATVLKRKLDQFIVATASLRTLLQSSTCLRVRILQIPITNTHKHTKFRFKSLSLLLEELCALSSNFGSSKH